jgi:peptidoglycan/xylan/chitin deacetylase (PgdA/CDA1 family)
MYHRIAEVSRDPWELSVTPANFEQQLLLLQEKYSIISVPELIAQVDNQAVAANSVCLTFDDGYTDNYHVAAPLLEKYKTPSTFFIPTQNLIAQEPFWWDELESIIFDSEKLPSNFVGNINGERIELNLDDEAILSSLLLKQQNDWTWPHKASTKRCALYLSLWEHLKPLEHTLLQAELNKLKQWAGTNNVVKPSQLPMTLHELKAIAAHPLFDIGIHTATHPALSAHSYAVQKHELEENKKHLETYCSTPIKSVAFPYGDYNKTTLDIVRELSLSAAFCTKEFPVTGKSDITRLGRFQVKNWNNNSFEQALVRWFKSS